MESTTSLRASGGVDLVPTRLRRHAREQPDKRILAFLDEQSWIQESWTFGELDRRARSIAAHLQRQGRAGEVVALAYPSGLEFVSAFCGCLYAGAIAAPTSLPRSHGVDERMSTILADSGARCVLTSSRHQAAFERHLVPGGLDVEVIATDALADRSELWRPHEWRADELAFLQYTSGSTRSPCGVMIRHGNLVANLESMREVLCPHRHSVSISWLPLFHDMGLIAGVLEPLWVGYAAFLMAPATFVQSPLRWLRAFSRYHGTIGGGPNFAYQALVDAAKSTDTSDLDLSSWEFAWNGAEPIRASTLERFRETFASVGFRPETLMTSFGLAEATLLVTANSRAEPACELVVDGSALRKGRVRQCAEDGPRARRLVSSGRPASNTRVLIVQPEAGRETDADRVGEIWVRSDSVGEGYWRKPDESRATFGARLEMGEGPFLRTGDLGFMHRGELFVTGRLKDVIVIRGVNYYPQDLEHTVESAHPALGLGAGVVVGIEEAGRVQLVAMHEVRRDSWRTIDPGEVFDAIRRAVARDHQLALHGIVLIKPFSLPKTSSGKVQRARCRRALQERNLPSSSVLHQWWAPPVHVAPIDFTLEPLTQPGVLERQLVDWLRRELSLTNLSWKTPLMELGIDSLKGVELGNALSEAFNHSFSATLLIDYPNIEALAGLIREEVLGVEPSPVDSFRRSDTSPSAVDEVSLAGEIAALDPDELDAQLQRSIEDVLGGGGRA
jgi:acyl-CoA synthetase (AMP-forming)/AMP-acid ligase II/acyl carrier protein